MVVIFHAAFNIVSDGCTYSNRKLDI